MVAPSPRVARLKIALKDAPLSPFHPRYTIGCLFKGDPPPTGRSPQANMLPGDDNPPIHPPSNATQGSDHTITVANATATEETQDHPRAVPEPGPAEPEAPTEHNREHSGMDTILGVVCIPAVGMTPQPLKHYSQSGAINHSPGQVPASIIFPSPPIEPLPRDYFQHTYDTYLSKSALIAQRDFSLLVHNGRLIDLHRLHCAVLYFGGGARVTTTGYWLVIGGILGFVEISGSHNKPPISGLGVAQHLAYVYTMFLQQFDTLFVRTMMLRRLDLDPPHGRVLEPASPNANPSMALERAEGKV